MTYETIKLTRATGVAPTPEALAAAICDQEQVVRDVAIEFARAVAKASAEERSTPFPIDELVIAASAANARFAAALRRYSKLVTWKRKAVLGVA